MKIRNFEFNLENQSIRGGRLKGRAIALLFGLGLLGSAAPAWAHHPFGGETPGNALEGFLSGLGHPVVGLDHLAFVIAVGLLSAGLARGFWVPVAFVLSTVLGTVFHIVEFDLPALEIVIAGSVILAGALLAFNRVPQLPLLAGIAAIAGLFHGFAYGEAIIGAEMTPLFAYLAGFTVIQLAIALGVQAIAQQVGQRLVKSRLPFQISGAVIGILGLTFLAQAIV